MTQWASLCLRRKNQVKFDFKSFTGQVTVVHIPILLAYIEPDQQKTFTLDYFPAQSLVDLYFPIIPCKRLMSLKAYY